MKRRILNAKYTKPSKYGRVIAFANSIRGHGKGESASRPAALQPEHGDQPEHGEGETAHKDQPEHGEGESANSPAALQPEHGDQPEHEEGESADVVQPEHGEGESAQVQPEHGEGGVRVSAEFSRLLWKAGIIEHGEDVFLPARLLPRAWRK